MSSCVAASGGHDRTKTSSLAIPDLCLGEINSRRPPPTYPIVSLGKVSGIVSLASFWISPPKQIEMAQ
jgi:hypothetical protein